MMLKGRHVLVLMGLVACVACATPREIPAPAENLYSRVEEYWRLRQRKDLAGMYAFYSAGYRSGHSKEEFLKKTRLIRFDILEFRVIRAPVSRDRADVTVTYRTMSPKIMQPFDSEVTETWVRDRDGRWYKEREILILPFPDAEGKPQVVED